MGTDRPSRTERQSRIERPSIQVADLAQLYARGELPSAPDDPSALGDQEFGPVGGAEPPASDAVDPMEAFCVAWSMGFAPDSPALRRG
jgi:hypothetical protein